VKEVSSSTVGGHQNVGTRTNYTDCGGCVSGCSSFDVCGFASDYFGVDHEASSLASWAIMVTLDVMVYSSCLGADNVPLH